MVDLTAQSRRFRTHVEELQPAVNQSEATVVHDSTAWVLGDLYGLWDQYWKLVRNINVQAAQNEEVRDDADGETAAALAWARGENLHQAVEWGEMSDRVAAIVYDIVGVWQWPVHAGDRGRGASAQRAAWYDQHCASKDVWLTVKAAQRWFDARPELM